MMVLQKNTKKDKEKTASSDAVSSLNSAFKTGIEKIVKKV